MSDSPQCLCEDIGLMIDCWDMLNIDPLQSLFLLDLVVLLFQ